jgi:hypothetical protein
VGTFDSDVSNKTSIRYKAARMVLPLQKITPEPRKHAFALAKKIVRQFYIIYMNFKRDNLSPQIFSRRTK